jgi:hypothetical protein
MSARLRVFGDFLRAANAIPGTDVPNPMRDTLKGKLMTYRVVQEKT